MNPQIELIPMHLSQAPEIARLLNDYEVWKTLSDVVPFPYSEKDAECFISAVLAEESPLNSRTIVYNACVVGITGYQKGVANKQHIAVVGYWLGKEFWGRGIASQALRQTIDAAFTDPSIVRIEATAFSGNIASVRVMQKCGMKHEATIEKGLSKQGEIYDEELYSLIREEK